MLIPTSRTPFDNKNPYRPIRPETSKIIFLSCEGCVTEEEYFEVIKKLFDSVKSRIQFISVAENEVHTHHKCRTPEQERFISKSRPIQLVKKIDDFKLENKKKYEFEKYPDDEFWMITDVDNNWSNKVISGEMTYKEEWDEAIRQCDDKQYNYAISNPFFEIWLLLHHADCVDEDKQYAVTDEHSYEKTTYFSEKLRKLNSPLKKRKHLDQEHYTVENICNAVKRAQAMHIDKSDLQPHYLSSTVYIIINKVLQMMDIKIE